MALELGWMRSDAPYMPIATGGLLAVLEQAGVAARARWADTLQIETTATIEEVADLISVAPLPDVDLIAWPVPRQQAVKSSLKGVDDALATFRGLAAGAPEPERRLLHALVTDQVVDSDRVPVRSRLIRGVKSDLSAFRDFPHPTSEQLREELVLGPQFGAGKSGRALGLVPEVQTFGGTVGRDASTLNAESPLLSLLLRHGVIVLPPVGVVRGRRRIVGGPLISDDILLSWPRWTVPCGLRELCAIFSFGAVHALEPDAAALRARGVDAVYRSALQQLSTTVAVYRWGRRVA